MSELIDPVSGFVIPRAWVGRSALPRSEVSRRVASGLYALTASGAFLKRGLSTGTVGAAAAKAAVLSLTSSVSDVTVLTPVGIRVTVMVRARDGRATAQKPKSDYAGDVTERVIFEAGATEADKLQLCIGCGIGVVRKQGLRAPYGGPAVNPEARESVYRAIKEAVRDTSLAGALVRLSAINGKEISDKTLNQKVGVVGGISILGTTGFVEPWGECLLESAEDLVYQADQIVLTTGRTGLKYAKMYFPRYTVVLAGSNLSRVFQKTHGKEVIIFGLPALILKWGCPDILRKTAASTVQQLFDKDPYGKEISATLAVLKQRTSARIIIINRSGKIVRET
ncbi:MAG: cobalt-precorrin-5B (C(1))-methyltransferase [Halobacteriota archaeon]